MLSVLSYSYLTGKYPHCQAILGTFIYNSQYEGPEHNFSKKALKEAGWEDLPRAWPYRIESLWDLFHAMYEKSDGRLLDEKTKLFAKRFEKDRIKLSGFKNRALAHLEIYRALSGRHGGNNKAHFPWGQGNDYYRLFDPVFMVLKREDKGHKHSKLHAPISCEYLFNPYLQSLLDGKVVDWSEQTCPEFPKKHRKLRNRRLRKRCAEFKQGALKRTVELERMAEDTSSLVRTDGDPAFNKFVGAVFRGRNSRRVPIETCN